MEALPSPVSFLGYTSQPQGVCCATTNYISIAALTYMWPSLPASHSSSMSWTRISISDPTVDKRLDNKTKQIPFPYHCHTGHFPGSNIQDEMSVSACGKTRPPTTAPFSRWLSNTFLSICHVWQTCIFILRYERQWPLSSHHGALCPWIIQIRSAHSTGKIHGKARVVFPPIHLCRSASVRP